jgi:hypothetical protein
MEVTEGMVKRKLKREGKTPSYIAQYLRGWKQLDKRKSDE